jgi:outer membrane protein
MQHLQSSIALLCALLMVFPAASLGADPTASQFNYPRQSGFTGWFRSPYTPHLPAPVNLANSSRIESLLRAGNLYLSLQDVIALALENNIELELQRYQPQIAEVNLFRAQAGGFATAPSTTVYAGPASVTGAAPSSGLQNYLVAASTSIGAAPPNFDPTFVGGATIGHITTPQSNTVTTGTTALINRQTLSNMGISQNLMTGTLVNLGLTNNNSSTNGPRNDFNPATTSGLSLTVTQHLLNGFGPSLNTRQIRIARNNRQISDLTFKSQVVITVSAVKNLYWDLVSYTQNVRVQRDALAASQKLLENDQRQVDVGTMAPIEVTRAQAEIASRQQTLTVAETQLLQQETILKNALSRTGVLRPEIASAHVIPTDTIQVPEQEAIAPIQDLGALAISSRPELRQFNILFQNEQIAIQGTKATMLPTLDMIGTLTNNALAGQPNNLPLLPGQSRGAPSSFFVGGYGTVLQQIFDRNFPTYSLAFSLNIPIRNRAAEADLTNSGLVLRQQQLGMQRMENQIRLEVQNAVIGVQQARAQYASALLQRRLQQETVDAEQKKLEAGVSTTYNVILTQRDLVTAQSNEVTARTAYAKAKVEYDRATGQTLENNSILIDEALRGKVARPPSLIPPQ